mgnify:CR=1 FL=1
MSSYDTSIYDLLFNSEYDYGSWLIELKKHEQALKDFSVIIDKKVKETGEYYPEPDNVFRALRETPLENVKVVLWGMDPYPQMLDNGRCRAQGLSFSVPRHDNIPGSLRNMYKEMKTNFPMFEQPDHGDLTYLTDQGILLMNSALTHCPMHNKAYLKLWRRFTYLIISIINEKIDGCVHILLGKNAQELATHIQSRNIITAVHPSGLSCHRGFFGSKVFLKTNIILKQQEKRQINWNEDDNLEPTFVELLKK